MFFKILKLFGLDVPARTAEIRIAFEERVELVKDHVNRTAQAAAVLAALFVLAGLAALAALGVGLIALYSWVSLSYGQFYGFAAVGGVLIFLAVIMFASAMIKSNSWSAESAGRAAAKQLKLVQAHAERVAAAAEAIERPAIRPLPPPTQSLGAISASDLVEPLTLILSKMIKFPTLGNPLLDELLVHLRGSAQGVADEAIEGVGNAVRYGDRPQLAAALGGAILVGWLLARHRPHEVDAL
jgi:ABC-type multidrug transport system fused ATPase/permease subunit